MLTPHLAFGCTALGIVYLMTTKPGWIASIVAMVVSPVIGIALARLRSGRQSVASRAISEGITR